MSRSRFKPDDLAFFSGFIAGDSSFVIRANNAGTSWCCTLHVKLRADDTPLLASFRDWTGAGELFKAPARGGSHPQTSWTVGRRRDCMTIARILARRPPLGKAALQFDLWRQAVDIWMVEGGSSAALAALGARLRALHRSAKPVPCRVDISPSDLGPWLSGFASAEAYFGVSATGSPSFVINLRADDAPLLRLFQRTLTMGVLKEIPPSGRSQPAMRWHVGRRSDLRRLLALFDAHPPAHSTGRIAALRAGNADHHAAQRARSRDAVLAAVRRCIDELGHVPGATEFLRWRAANAPDSPCQMTIYRAFRGGFAEVLAAARGEHDEAA